MDWDESTPASEPSILEALERVRAQAGTQPSGTHMSSTTYARFCAALSRRAALLEALKTEKGLLRYLLRRQLGERRLRILWPWLDGRLQGLRWRRIEWKHRHDSEWQ